MNRYYKGMLISLWAVLMASILVQGRIQDVILERHQNTPASAAFPVQIELKGKAFNVSRKLKYGYEAAEVAIIAAAPLLFFIYWLGWRKRKILASAEPPLG
jgi:hypothetical protein